MEQLLENEIDTPISINTDNTNASLTVTNTGPAASFLSSGSSATMTISNSGGSSAIDTDNAINVGNISSTGAVSAQILELDNIQIGKDELQTLQALHAGKLVINLTSGGDFQLYDSTDERSGKASKHGFYALTAKNPEDMSNCSTRNRKDWTVTITSNQLTAKTESLIVKKEGSSSRKVDIAELILKVDALTKKNDVLLNKITVLESKCL